MPMSSHRCSSIFLWSYILDNELTNTNILRLEFFFFFVWTKFSQLVVTWTHKGTNISVNSLNRSKSQWRWWKNLIPRFHSITWGFVTEERGSSCSLHKKPTKGKLVESLVLFQMPATGVGGIGVSIDASQKPISPLAVCGPEFLQMEGGLHVETVQSALMSIFNRSSVALPASSWLL